MPRPQQFACLLCVCAALWLPLTALALEASSDDSDRAGEDWGSGLRDGLRQLSEGLSRTGDQLSENLSAAGSRLAENLGESLDRTAGNLRAILDGSGSGLVAALGRLNAGGSELLQRLSGRFVEDVPGSTHFEMAVPHQGLGRRVVVIRPEHDTPGDAPVLLLLHYANGNPAHMANLTRVGRLAAQHGLWVLLPEAVNGQWREDPNGLDGIDDVGFLDAVVSTALRDFPLDPARVHVAGMSKGAFMATRLACQGQTRIAGMGLVAGSLRRQQALQCSNEAPRRVMAIHGADDRIVPYDGRFGLFSAARNFAHWEQGNACVPDAASEESLPIRRDDGTRVRLLRNTECAEDGAVALATVEGGGHTWPGSDPIGGALLGNVSANIDATEALWTFLDGQP